MKNLVLLAILMAVSTPAIAGDQYRSANMPPPLMVQPMPIEFNTGSGDNNAQPAPVYIQEPNPVNNYGEIMNTQTISGDANHFSYDAYGNLILQ
jgi:hypothetical protein